MTRVHQFHPVLAPGDAMSGHVIALDRRIRSWGHEARMYAIEAKPGVEDVLPYRRLFRDVRPDDVVLVHFSMGHEIFTQLAKLTARKVLVYHNVTPAQFFTGINPHAAVFARLGRRQLGELAPHFDLAIGVSEYNRRELEAAGYAHTVHVPILIDWARYDLAPDDAVIARWQGIAPVLLFVGRISPNKRQDDLIRMLAYYRRCIDREARLILVGAYRDQPQYHARLLALVSELGLEGAVTFAGAVPLAELVAYYRIATSSSRCPSTRASASRSSRRCTSASRSSRSTRPRSARPSAVPASSCRSATSPRLPRPSRSSPNARTCASGSPPRGSSASRSSIPSSSRSG